ncbi:MAG TPA: MSHA biogenesis protein MshI, partial [Burkholderiales bacterium]|nr:MSHA biogenesis protein MshI [Burkholderiales bacterium]
MQQINLYRPIFRKQEKKFSALAMLQAGAAIAVGIAIIYGLIAWQVRDLRAELAQVDKRLAASTNRLDDATKRFGPGTKSKLLEDQVTDLEKQIAARLRVRELLSRGIFSNTTGYSDFLVAFARQHVTGLWLTGFDIVGAGEDMRLQGQTSDPALVPRYVQRLSAEQALAGKEFRIFTMSRPVDKSDTVTS